MNLAIELTPTHTKSCILCADSYFIKGNHKKALENYKQITDKEKKKIKIALGELGQSEYSTHGYKVKLTKRTTQQLDEDGMIEFLLSNGIKDCVKTKYYLDSEALEKAIYNGDIPSDKIAEMGKFTKEKVTYAVGIVKVGD